MGQVQVTSGSKDVSSISKIHSQNKTLNVVYKNHTVKIYCGYIATLSNLRECVATHFGIADPNEVIVEMQFENERRLATDLQSCLAHGCVVITTL
jgi:hypothetical protein